MSVELITTQGSHAGTVAKIHPGYYLVGRHRECQIRPKSRSVSRRHCLLLHNEDGFGALDLKSTSGTWINGTRLHPHEWRVLSDGDQIRFGKVAFKVSIKNASFATVAAGNKRPISSADETSDSAISTPPISWQSQEVAEFLELEDQAEFELDHGDLGTPRPDQDRATGPRGRSAIDEELDDEFNDEFDDEFNVLADGETGSRQAGDTLIGDAAGETFDESADDEKPIEVDSKPKKRPPNRKIDHAQYKRRPKRSMGLPRFRLNFGSGEGVDWRLIGTIALIVFSIGVLGYQVHRFTAGPDLEVRRGLD